MQTKFKRHQEVVLLRSPDPEYVEYYNDQTAPIVKGMKGKVNIILPNGKYHVEIYDNKGEIIGYAPFEEEDLEGL